MTMEQKPFEMMEKPSPVILLTNMVGPGEVDDMLQEETADECSKYGKVERCLIFEVKHAKNYVWLLYLKKNRCQGVKFMLIKQCVYLSNSQRLKQPEKPLQI